MSARLSQAVKRQREEEERKARDAAIPMPDDRPRLLFGVRPTRIYVAVCDFGFGIHEVAAAAIRLAQDEVPAKSKPRQLLVYETLSTQDFDMVDLEAITPKGFNHGDPLWPLGAEMRLVGLTTTHSLFVQTPRA